ncbi:T9SS type A sorting domain-containing protein [Flavobacterium beibuense]|uniref:Internalin-related protein n=1 Tax=Flavobacterium beibuense TaxID=657326 RepID=A0A444WIQ1_9FLAO|nr:T9SS type A sorting domain-containing protein [Flavobacterium beibuense]RYJ45562.1 Internalin-related protein [Flavobacterium beibuense]
MKKKLLYLLLLFSGIVSAQIVNIPDINFKNKLLSASISNDVAKDVNGNSIVIDVNNDYEIQVSEALLVWELNLFGAGITDATGLEYFTNLRSLECSNNSGLTSLDLTSLINLEGFDCDAGTGLEFLSFAGLSNLQTVYISDTNLETINLTGTIGMQEFVLEDVPVSNLDFSYITDLTKLELYNTNLINIDLSNSSFLPLLKCIGNNLLETINLKNGNSFYVGLGSDISDNPNLNFICVDEGEESLVEGFIGSGNNPSYSSYCSFTPGGDYNIITGNAVFDADSDGCGPEDFPYPFVKLSINDDAEEGYVFTNTNGEYSFYTQEGDFTVTPEFEDDWFTVTPASVNFPVVDGSVSVQNFCIAPNGVHNDVEVVMVPVVPAMPGFDAVYKIVYKNKGNQIASGTVGCAWDYQILTPVALEPMADDIGLGIYGWNYSNLQPFENREILMTLHVNSPTDEPAVYIDDVLPFTANINGGTDENPGDNEYVFNQIVIGAYDPNNIICIEGETASVDDIGNYLHYVVNFENTGTAAASFVVVKHIINETDFDISSLQILNSSHQVEARITGNVIEFIFANINLNALDHGNILFKLKSKADLAEGDQVMNQANIYFDYNSPVETNEAITEFAGILGTGEFIQDTSVKVYPNPATDMITIMADANLQSISLYDIQGRLLQTQLVNNKETKLNISDRQKGIYLLKITSDKGVKVEKIVKE